MVVQGRIEFRPSNAHKTCSRIAVVESFEAGWYLAYLLQLNTGGVPINSLEGGSIREPRNRLFSRKRRVDDGI